ATPIPAPVRAFPPPPSHLVLWFVELGGLMLAVGRGRSGADTVDGAAVSDGHHPRRRATHGRVEPCGGPPHLEEDLLGYLLGLGRITKNPADHAVRRADQPVVHRLKRFLVATRHVDKQVVKVPLSPPIRGRGLEPGRVRIARIHMTPSEPASDRMGGTWPNFK